MSSSLARSPSIEPLLGRRIKMNSSDINQTDSRAIKTNGTNLHEMKPDLIKKDLDKRLFSIDEDSIDQPTTTRKELWSYYLYCNGNNGVGPTSYSQALFQSALSRAGWDPAIIPIIRGNCTTGGCVIP